MAAKPLIGINTDYRSARKEHVDEVEKARK
jgi:hypothetical protein